MKLTISWLINNDNTFVQKFKELKDYVNEDIKNYLLKS